MKLTLLIEIICGTDRGKLRRWCLLGSSTTTVEAIVTTGRKQKVRLQNAFAFFMELYVGNAQMKKRKENMLTSYAPVGM